MRTLTEWAIFFLFSQNHLLDYFCLSLVVSAKGARACPVTAFEREIAHVTGLGRCGNGGTG